MTTAIDTDTQAAKADVAGQAAAHEPGRLTVPLPPELPPTPTTRALWAALIAKPQASANELADAAEIGRSTATKALVDLEKAGLATRNPGGRQGARRLPDQWEAVIPTTASEAESSELLPQAQPNTTESVELLEVEEDAAEESSDPQNSPSGEDSELARTQAEPGQMSPSGRLRPGQLRDQVLHYLEERPEQELSPGAIGNALSRSAGAVSNCCEKLAHDRVLTLSRAKPRRYRVVQ
jgi:hypothetical protein